MTKLIAATVPIAADAADIGLVYSCINVISYFYAEVADEAVISDELAVVDIVLEEVTAAVDVFVVIVAVILI